jgi:antibiotic biosynthesis monooxygenase (ABM) superfamily enzyme
MGSEMYGTVARMRVKPGMESQLLNLMSMYQGLDIPGMRHSFAYRMDTDPSEYYLAVVFDSKEDYLANAASPEQDARYREYRALLESDPEWHDGTITYSLA